MPSDPKPASNHPAQTPEFWENLYQTQHMPWDLGRAAPPFASFLNSANAVPAGSIAIVGCGAGHECLLFAKQGFKVTGFDFADSAIAETRQKLSKEGFYPQNAAVIQNDIFSLQSRDDWSQISEQFDYVLEHTCFCAIHPSQRSQYKDVVRSLLKPGGKFISLWWLLDKEDGPPFKVEREEIFQLFQDNFKIELEYFPTDSVPKRQGKELFTVMTKLN